MGRWEMGSLERCVVGDFLAEPHKSIGEGIGETGICKALLA
jgi:hypothetical protein